MGRRRMLLLVAVLLGVSALAASLSPTPRDSGDDSDRPPPPASERRAPESASVGSVRLRFDAGRPTTRTVPAGSHVVLEVSVPEPADVELPSFGLRGTAVPGTPATFDILVEKPSRIELRWARPGANPESAGTLLVERAG